MTNEIKLYLKGLDCANCANKIENKVNKLESVEEAVLNFSLSLLIVNLKENSDVNKVEEEIKTIVNNLEPHVIVSKYDNNIKEKKNVCTSECCSGHAHNVEEKHEESHEHNHSEGVSLRDKVTLAIGFILFAIAIFIGEEKSYVPYIYEIGRAHV